ncbi:MAG: hypothetical protein H6747_04545 [Deltaproteobacteria bacterium]|nr:hypothetical protein [Deltaproteobacteria bacterium]
MTRIFAPLVLSLALLPAAAGADVAAPCRGSISTPTDGATSVPLDVVIRGGWSCESSKDAPSFVDEDGAVVAATLTDEGAEFSLTPDVPLLPDRAYRLEFPVPTCNKSQALVRFTTAVAPTLVAVRSFGTSDEVHAIGIELSEPLAAELDADAATGFVSVAMSDFAAKPVLSLGPAFASLTASYKTLTNRPPTGGKVRVTLRKGLPFASGATLQADIVRTFAIDDGDAVLLQPAGIVDSCSSAGCSAATHPGHGALPATALLVLFGLGLSFRRRVAGVA